MTLATAKMSVDRASDLLLPEDRRGRNTLRGALSHAVQAHDGPLDDLRERLDKVAANDPGRLVDLVVVLGALVDVDRTPSDLLAWMCPTGQKPRPRGGELLCGTIDGHIAHVQADQDPCRPCQSAFDTLTMPVQIRDKLATCPSPAGWQRHKRAGEDPCDGCKDAMRAYWQGAYDRNYKPVGGTSTKIIGCPSRAGYDRHVRLGEDPCDGCIAERRRYFREKGRERTVKVRAKKAPRQLKECRTVAARKRHMRKRERCDECWPPGGPITPIWYPPLGHATAA